MTTQVYWEEGLEIDPKDPSDVLQLVIDWSSKLGNDVINVANVSAEAGLNVNNLSHTDSLQTIEISGGSADRYYDVTVSISTASGQAFERSFTQPVKEL